VLTGRPFPVIGLCPCPQRARSSQRRAARTGCVILTARQQPGHFFNWLSRSRSSSDRSWKQRARRRAITQLLIPTKPARRSTWFEGKPDKLEELVAKRKDEMFDKIAETFGAPSERPAAEPIAELIRLFLQGLDPRSRGTRSASSVTSSSPTNVTTWPAGFTPISTSRLSGPGRQSRRCRRARSRFEVTVLASACPVQPVRGLSRLAQRRARAAVKGRWATWHGEGVGEVVHPSRGWPNGPHFSLKYSRILLAWAWLTSTNS